MAIKIAANLKKETLESIGIAKIGHDGMGDSYDVVSVTPVYGVTGMTNAYLEVSNVVLPVNGGTTVNQISLFTNQGLRMATIDLEGSEIHEYDVNGTYTINNLRISF